MKDTKTFLQPFLLCFFAALYNFFFWGEDFGLNIFLFSNLLLLAVIYLHNSLLNNRLAQLLIVGTVASSLALLYHNSLNSKIAWFMSFMATVAVLQNTAIKLLFNAWIVFIINLFVSLSYLPEEVMQLLKRATKNSHKLRAINRRMSLLLIPIIIFSVFYVIFNIANPIFAEYNSRLWEAIFQFIASMSSGISFLRIVFILSGFWVVSAILYYWKTVAELETMQICGTHLIERNRNQRSLPFKILDLKNEFQIAFLVIASVNVLLLVVNLIDIRFLWFGFTISAGVKLAALVHEGTYMLIFSILLSMGILFYYFRQNLNFYKNNKWIKNLAIVWLVQNAILLISVLLRCHYYILEHGLAYKRIGVILFLLLTFIGLITFYDKIKNRKSAFYLLHINSIAAYLLLIATSFINWDKLIVNFNFHHPNLNKGSIDIPFILSRSYSTLPIVYENASKIDMNLQELNEYYYEKDSNGKTISRKAYIEQRRREFLANYAQISWLSWTFTSANLYETLPK
jgi:hypothetical protein